MICYSGSYQNMIDDPERPYQWSHFDASTAAYDGCDYFEALGRAFPGNMQVLHTPPRLNPSRLVEFLALVEAQENFKGPVVIHPNAAVIDLIEQYDIRNLEWLCFENFPLASKKALRSPLDLLAWTSARGFGLCYDYAHVDSPVYKSFDFLKYFLKYVSVIHFSGWGHERLEDADWKLWRNLFANSPASFAATKAFVLEHKKLEDKAADGRRLATELKNTSHRFK